MVSSSNSPSLSVTFGMIRIDCAISGTNTLLDLLSSICRVLSFKLRDFPANSAFNAPASARVSLILNVSSRFRFRRALKSAPINKAISPRLEPVNVPRKLALLAGNAPNQVQNSIHIRDIPTSRESRVPPYRKISSLDASVIDGFALRQSANVKPAMSYPRLAKTAGQFPGEPIREIVTRPS